MVQDEVCDNCESASGGVCLIRTCVSVVFFTVWKMADKVQAHNGTTFC